MLRLLYSIILKKIEVKCVRKKAFGKNNIIYVTQFVNDRIFLFYKIAFRFIDMPWRSEFVFLKIFIILTS